MESVTHMRSWRLRGGVALAALSLGLTACGGSDTTADAESSDGLTKVQAVTVTVSGAYWRELVAKKLGFFEDEGLDVEYTFAKSNTSIDALISDSAEIGLSDATLATQAIKQGAELTIVGQGVDSQPYYLVTAKDVPTVADLKGKTVGAENDANVYTEVMKELLKNAGVDPDDVDFVYGLASSTDRASALEGGAVSAALLVPPATAHLEQEGFHLAASVLDVVPQMTQSATVANAAWAKDHPDQVAAYLAALSKAVEWLEDPANKEQAVDILSEATESSKEDSEVAYTEYVERKVFDTNTCVHQDAVKILLDRLADIDVVDPMTPDDVSTTEYCPES